MARTGAVENVCKEISRTEAELFCLLSEDRVRSLCPLLNEHIAQHNVSPAIARQIKIEILVSCYVFDTLSQTLEKVLFAGREFGLVLIGRIKELVHSVPKDLSILMIDDASRRKRACLNLAKRSCGWEADQFHVNRSYVQ